MTDHDHHDSVKFVAAVQHDNAIADRYLTPTMLNRQVKETGERQVKGRFRRGRLTAARCICPVRFSLVGPVLGVTTVLSPPVTWGNKQVVI